MTNVTYTYTDDFGNKKTTTSYAEFTQYRAKDPKSKVIYTPVIEPIPEKSPTSVEKRTLE